MKISFYGAAQGVTGSNFLVDTNGTQILIDCGLHQEGSFCEPRNAGTFPYDPKRIAALCITHAHLDHIGRIPKLVKEGFIGKIIATAPTFELMMLTLQDTIHIIEGKEDEDCPTVFTEEDLHHVEELFVPTRYGETVTVADGVRVTLTDAGHVLGSAMVAIEGEGKRVVCTGDVGNAPTPLLNDPTPLGRADAVVIDSTYGGRNHEDRANRRLVLERTIEDIVTRRGVLMI
ncbi:MBL fold metallo-hydrolase, partial [Candidatus Uhrbacteria bacterium]|nr:MBL fold metallo-hydrolase [Candidatus Uhrbacteria bacterium]